MITRETDHAAVEDLVYIDNPVVFGLKHGCFGAFYPEQGPQLVIEYKRHVAKASQYRGRGIFPYEDQQEG